MNFFKFFIGYYYSFKLREVQKIDSKIIADRTPEREISRDLDQYIIFLDNPNKDIYFPFKRVNIINSRIIINIFNEIPEILVCNSIIIYYNKDKCKLDLLDFNIVSNKNNLDNDKLNIVQVDKDVYQLLPLKDQKEYIKIWNFYNSHFLKTNAINFNIYLIGTSFNSIFVPPVYKSYFNFKNMKLLHTQLLDFKDDLVKEANSHYKPFINSNPTKGSLFVEQYKYVDRLYTNYFSIILFLFSIHPYYTIKLNNLNIVGNLNIISKLKGPFQKYIWYDKDAPLTLEWLKYYLKRTIINNNQDKNNTYYIFIYYNGSYERIDWNSFRNISYKFLDFSLKIDNYSFIVFFRDIFVDNFFNFTFSKTVESCKLLIDSWDDQII